MRALALLCVLCALGGALAAAVAVSGAGAAERTSASATVGNQLIAQIDHYRSLTWRWQRLMGLPVTHSAESARQSPDPAYRRWVLSLWRGRAVSLQHRALPWMAVQVRGYRETVSHWQHVMGLGPAPTRATAADAGGLGYREWEFRLWRNRARAVIRQAEHPPYAAAFACIHRFEGSWSDHGAPYYGGLQMDLGFQSTYGGYLLRTKGTADHWTPLEQMWVAARAARSGRGFSPWPNSARICGLI
ncbi:MAG: hypothetical protein ACXVZN_12805 [Gaiellaceae bacterium]